MDEFPRKFPYHPPLSTEEAVENKPVPSKKTWYNSKTTFMLWSCILLVTVLTALVGMSQIPTDTPAGTEERVGKVSEEVQQPGNAGCSSESWAAPLCQEEEQAAHLSCH